LQPVDLFQSVKKAANRQNTRLGKDFDKSLLLEEKMEKIFDF